MSATPKTVTDDCAWALATASIALAAVASAQAQSSVTVFGVADIGYVHTSASGVSKNQLASDGNTSSRLGFRGTEDLGGGMKAGFWLEGALAIDSPATLSLTRRSTVELMGNFGEIRLGRDYVPTFTNLTVANHPFGANVGTGRCTASGYGVIHLTRVAQAVGAKGMVGHCQVGESRHVIPTQTNFTKIAHQFNRGAACQAQRCGAVNGQSAFQPEASLHATAEVLRATETQTAGRVAIRSQLIFRHA